MPADLILTGGKICTVDPARPWAEAAAVVGERIAAVGSARDLEAWTGPGTRLLDLQGRMVLPGFTDAHVHFMEGGQTLLGVQLRDAATPEAFVARIAAKARELPAGTWILGGNWDHQSFPGAELPRREWIDAVTPDHPVSVSRMDGHMALCNSLALRMAGVDRGTPTPAGGAIVRDPATGEPTGILKDAARNLVRRIIPEPTAAQLRAMAETALAAAAAKGVTTVHDVSGERGFAVYQDLLGQGQLTCRIAFYLPIVWMDNVFEPDLVSGLRSDTRWGSPRGDGEGAERARDPLSFLSAFGSTRLRFAGLKGFTDGSLGSGTALFFEPYSDEPGNCGLFHDQMFPEGVMAQRVQAADRHGLNVAVHAIGDRAIATLLDIFQEAAGAGGFPGLRLRVEHVQHVRPADFERLARLGVVASVQPYHGIDDGRWAEGRIGPQRVKWAFPYRSLLDAGVPLAFGSDWPVAPMDPIQGIYAAVTRRTLDGRHPDGWVPAQKVPLAAAIHASTMGGACAECAEREKGSVTAGKLADFVVLDRNLFEIRPEEIAEAQVVATICGGEVVYQR
jgi:predicted amidohydrolase YtcJ